MIQPYLSINLPTYLFALKKDVIVPLGRHLPHNLREVVKLGAGWLQQRHPQNRLERFPRRQVVVVIWRRFKRANNQWTQKQLHLLYPLPSCDLPNSCSDGAHKKQNIKGESLWKSNWQLTWKISTSKNTQSPFVIPSWCAASINLRTSCPRTDRMTTRAYMLASVRYVFRSRICRSFSDLLTLPSDSSSLPSSSFTNFSTPSSFRPYSRFLPTVSEKRSDRSNRSATCLNPNSLKMLAKTSLRRHWQYDMRVSVE